MNNSWELQKHFGWEVRGEATGTSSWPILALLINILLLASTWIRTFLLMLADSFSTDTLKATVLFPVCRHGGRWLAIAANSGLWLHFAPDLGQLEVVLDGSAGCDLALLCRPAGILQGGRLWLVRVFKYNRYIFQQKQPFLWQFCVKRLPSPHQQWGHHTCHSSGCPQHGGWWILSWFYICTLMYWEKLNTIHGTTSVA